VSAALCDDFRDELPEFALGLLDGDERAALINHLSSCPSCRDEAAQLGLASDALLAAVAGDGPSVGFEDRVLARLPAAAPGPDDPAPADELAARRRRPRLWLAVAAALLVLLLIAGIAAAVGRSTSGGANDASRVRTAMMLTTQGRVVGKVTVTAHPTAVLVAAPGWNDGGDHTYRLVVRLADGHTVDDGRIVLDDGYGGYGLAGVQLSDVRRVDMVDAAGHIACTATFS
jgi:anti-sigma factor RsiW